MAAKEPGGRVPIGSIVDRYQELDALVSRLWQIPFNREALEKHLEIWEGPIAGRLDRTCDLGVLTFLGIISRTEAERLVEMNIPYSALIQAINRKHEIMFEMKTEISNVTRFFDWIDRKLAVNHATIIKFNRDGGALGHVSIYANVGGIFGTIDPQTEKTTVRNDVTFLKWAKSAGFTSISLPMISVARPDKLLKFKFDEVCERGRDKKRLAGETNACVYNVYSLLGILDVERGKALASSNKAGVSRYENERLLFSKHVTETFRRNPTKIFNLPADSFEFEVFMSTLRADIGVGKCIPVFCGRAGGIGHMFIMAVDQSGRLCVIEDDGVVYADVREYFLTERFTTIGFIYENKKISRLIGPFAEEVRKVVGDKQLTKKRKADHTETGDEQILKKAGLVDARSSTASIDSTGAMVPAKTVVPAISSSQKRINKMKKTVKKLRESRKKILGTTRDAKLARDEIDKEKSSLKREIIRLQHNGGGMGKSRTFRVRKDAKRNTMKRRK